MMHAYNEMLECILNNLERVYELPRKALTFKGYVENAYVWEVNSNHGLDIQGFDGEITIISNFGTILDVDNLEVNYYDEEVIAGVMT